jgi:hypothetical protein
MKEVYEHGVYLWWPERGEEAFHPEDRAAAHGLIPSDRVWRRAGRQGPYIVLEYGATQLRVEPTLFERVTGEGFEIGHWVEVLSKLGKNERRTGAIREMRWDQPRRRILYFLQEAHCNLPSPFTADDLRHVERAPLDSELSREIQITPAPDVEGDLELE